MRLRPLTCALLLFCVLQSSAWAQVEVSAGQSQRLYSSPMVVKIPLKRFPIRTTELNQYECDAVRIESLEIRRLTHTSMTDVLRIEVVVRTRPPKDKWARLSVRIIDGEEVLALRGPRAPNHELESTKSKARSRVTDAMELEFDAEEEKLRKGKAEYWVDSGALDRVLGGEEPKLILELQVVDN